MDELPQLPPHFDGESIYSSAEMRAYAAAAVAAERERICAALEALQARTQSHNYYACTAVELREGKL